MGGKVYLNLNTFNILPITVHSFKYVSKMQHQVMDLYIVLSFKWYCYQVFHLQTTLLPKSDDTIAR